MEGGREGTVKDEEQQQAEEEAHYDIPVALSKALSLRYRTGWRFLGFLKNLYWGFIILVFHIFVC